MEMFDDECDATSRKVNAKLTKKPMQMSIKGVVVDTNMQKNKQGSEAIKIQKTPTGQITTCCWLVFLWHQQYLSTT